MTTPPAGYPGQQPPAHPQAQPPAQPHAQPQGRPQGQPPPYGPPQQYGQPGQPGPPQFPPGQPPAAPPRTPAQKVASAVAVLGLVSLLGVVLGLSISEDDRTAWDSVNAWGGLAIAGSVLTMVPAFGHAIGLGAQRAWQVAACGAGALVLFWVLFTLPEVGSNTSLLTTVGVAAGVVAVWIAPGRGTAAPDQAAPSQRTW